MCALFQSGFLACSPFLSRQLLLQVLLSLSLLSPLMISFPHLAPSLVSRICQFQTGRGHRPVLLLEGAAERGGGGQRHERGALGLGGARGAGAAPMNCAATVRNAADR